ncbi:MAG: hypothetical protein OXG85_14285 [Chloroflexi bacterium]|nr:hypothetical protein [Chloroflexota bacterium]
MLFCLICLMGSLITLRAQDSVLRIGSVVEGSLAAGETRRYALTALELTLASLRVEALTEGLDPTLTILDGAGEMLISNDDYDYPEALGAAIQAFVFPRTSTYTIAVSAFGDGAGAYRLHIQPGYDRVALRESPVDSANWEVVYSDASVNISEASVFALEMRGLARSAGMVGLHFPIESDLYFEVAFDQVNSPSVWQVGLLFRYLSPSRYHRLLLSKRGYWRVDRVDGDSVTPLVNWKTHPAIAAGARSFRLGVLVSGQHYDIVYNGQVVGAAWDRAPLQAGSLGIALNTDERTGGAMSFVVAETLVTTPTRVDGKVLFPQRLLASGYYALAQALARQQLVPVGGEVKVAVPESSVRGAKPGVTRLPIASSFSFAQFAFGVSLTLDTYTEGNGGCGLYFHFNDEDNYTLAYVTSQGDYGLSRRARDGFAPGIYDNRPAAAPGAHNMLAIVSDEVIHFYLDERYVGSLDSQPRIGGVGIATVNYDEVDTSCAFKDLWLLSLDN